MVMIVEFVMNIPLVDDDTEYGGIAFVGETLGDFLSELEEDEMPNDLEELNAILKSCGICPIRF